MSIPYVIRPENQALINAFVRLSDSSIDYDFTLFMINQLKKLSDTSSGVDMSEVRTVVRDEMISLYAHLYDNDSREIVDKFVDTFFPVK